LFWVGPGVWDNAHSLYARTLAEHGILGFASILLLILTLVIGTFCQALQETKKPYGLSAKVVLACLVGLVLNSAVIDTIHWRHFWLVLALAWVVSARKDPSLPDDLD
jgi:O-antigen ligase